VIWRSSDFTQTCRIIHSITKNVFLKGISPDHGSDYRIILFILTTSKKPSAAKGPKTNAFFANIF
jgi:hypothetical protein